jgi:hypothetical protein
VRTLAGEELVHHEAERVKVALHRSGLASQLLRSHVRGRSGDLRFLIFGRRECQAEVRDTRVSARVEHHVRRFEIAMHDPFRMRSHQPRRNSSGDVDGLVMRQAADAAEQTAEVFAVDVLHGHEVRALPFHDVVDAADVRVRDLAAEADLVVQTAEERRVARQSRGQELQRHLLIELRVIGAIDLAHPARAENRRDPIASGNDRPGRELRAVRAKRQRLHVRLQTRGDVLVGPRCRHG